jgi:hypothetical protein
MEVKKKGAVFAAPSKMAEWTGLEPATLGVTGRYSNRLNYHSSISLKLAVPLMVGAEGIEPPTTAL